MESTLPAHKDATRLAFDCSVVGVSAALIYQEQLYVRRDHSGNKQAGRLLPMLGELLEEAGIGYETVDTIITTVGPGSFTGIRIGLAAAQGILAARPMQLRALSTLEALAYSAHGVEMVRTALNAGKGEIYTQLFHVKHAQPKACGDMSLVSPEAFMALHAGEMLMGNARAMLPSLADALWSDTPLPDAAAFIYSIAPPVTSEALVPLYIRAPDAKLPAVPLPLE